MGIRNTPRGAEGTNAIEERFGIAQDGKPLQTQLALQKSLRDGVVSIAHLLDANVEDCREKSLALTAMEEALMWAGKAIFK